MKLRSFLTVVAIWTQAATSYAQGVQDIQIIRKEVLTHAENYFQEVHGIKAFKNNVELTVGRLDPRLRLAKCDKDLTLKIQEPPHGGRNSTVKTSCQGTKRWTVYIPLTVDIYSEVVVANKGLVRGDVLTDDDLTYRRMNIAKNGYGLVDDIEKIKGLELKRPLRQGETLKKSYLTYPDIVLKGQPVMVSSSSRFLTVEAPGVALKNGHMGEFIKVKNERSQRIVDAKVVAPGKVAVASR